MGIVSEDARIGLRSQLEELQYQIELSPGDCLDYQVLRVDCDHGLAMYSVVSTIEIPESENLPSKEEIKRYRSMCPTEAKQTFSPNHTTWSKGDRWVTCVKLLDGQ